MCRLGLAISPFPAPISSCTSPHVWWVILNPNRLLNRRPHHTVARLQPPGAHRGLGAWCSISNGARGGWSRWGQDRTGVWVGTGVELDWAGPVRMCPSPNPLSHNQTSFCSLHKSCKCTHCCVCTHVCAVTIPLVLLCKELILVWPTADQPLFAPQNERIINSKTESNVFFSCFSKNV